MSTAVTLLRRLIRADTSNPPGNETAAAVVLRDFLDAHGVDCKLLARDPKRANVVARVRGGSGPSLAFLAHLDVVPAHRPEWSAEPFGGELRDGWVIGRGAVDMKSQVAAVAVALTQLERPPGDVLLVAVADEEVGEAEVGMPWLVEARRDVRADFVVGEGAGERYETDGGAVWTVDVGVKASARATLRVSGRSGDASLPWLADNPLPELGRLLTRLAPPPPPATPLESIRRANAATTVTPTRVKTHDAANVVPPHAEATLYCSVLPGTTRAGLERELRELLGPGAYALDVSEPNGGSRSPEDTPLRAAIEAFVRAEDDGAQVLPILGYGYSDCHLAREAWGAVAHGFIPFRHGDPSVNLETKHGRDERVRVEDVELQVTAAKAIAAALA